jgi:quercetin dioxygenase-like cupin family protein
MKKNLLLTIIGFSFIFTSNTFAKDEIKENVIKNQLSDTVIYNQDKFQKNDIFKSKNFEVVAFAFTQGQGLKEHSTEFDAFIYLIEGEAEISIGKKIYILKKGDYINLPANIPHSIKAKTDFKMTLTKPLVSHHH